MLVLRLLLALQLLLLSRKLGHEFGLLQFSHLVSDCCSCYALFQARAFDQNVVNQAFECFRKSLLTAMLQLKVGQIFVQLSDLYLPLGLLLSEIWLKVETSLPYYVIEDVKAQANLLNTLLNQIVL